MPYQIDAERLAYWYFRLNGFLTIENFVLHDEMSHEQRTEFDLLAVRFPNRREVLRTESGGDPWMHDDKFFNQKGTPLAALIEVTTARCKLNGRWTDAAKGNMQRINRALGIIPEPMLDEVSNHIYRTGSYLSDPFEIQLIAVGSEKNKQIKPPALQITWDEVSAFIFDRFEKFDLIKEWHPQWDLDGHLLWEVFKSSAHDKHEFVASILPVEGKTLEPRNPPTQGDIAKYRDLRHRK